MLKYVNHVGEEIVFNNNNGIFLNENDLRDYNWNYDVTYKKITNLDNPTRKHKLPVRLAGQDRIANANKIFSVIDKDVVENATGKFYIDDYYLEGYFISSNKSKYTSGVVIWLDLGFVSTGMWHREVSKTYNYLIVDEKAGQIDLDYPHDAPHDYTSPQDVQMNNENYTASDFRIIIYGPATRPEIYIANHKYAINTNIAAGEYVVIDSANKKITRTTHRGEQINLFNLRDRNSYIFEKIPSGLSEVTWNGPFSFDVVLIEDRSEPKWT